MTLLSLTFGVNEGKDREVAWCVKLGGIENLYARAIYNACDSGFEAENQKYVIV